MTRQLYFIFFLFVSVPALAAPGLCINDGIASRYNNADLVVVGQVNRQPLADHNLRFAIEKIIKGNAPDEIILQGQNAPTSGTEWNGFGFPSKWDKYLLFLQKSGAVYVDVEPFNSGCYRFFPIEGSDVIIDDNSARPLKVSEGKIKEYLESHPKPFTQN